MLVDILTFAQVFAEVAVKAASDVWIHGFELSEIVIREVNIGELWVDEKISYLFTLYNFSLDIGVFWLSNDRPVCV